MKVKIKRLNESIKLPTYAHEDDSGMDVYSPEEFIFFDNRVHIIKCGFCVEVPVGFELQVRPRSGLSSKTMLRVANAPGTIDAGYRDEVGIIMQNIGRDVECVKKGDRIAQLVLCPIIKCKWDEVLELDESSERKGGFGSSGD